ncbi:MULTISPECIES: SDR family NAD(P)-dependent oxidoreductase [unclassified Cryobacterium]|uniref:SDR family NAD(P)-dependent oxidoreductase n=1 Tax=unclassified Cryobacterium TaxID=2649013 RepID=UPI00106DB781|nr:MULTISPECIES: SDR family NAD(P)-dependent oxidoreductase [unclassified Cryobacterium]TFB97050.1 SDR family NAD(P)-dependent oxidoreductase [Cryobacterium sp. MDB2-A-1]TFC08913.1 SDR family NAD(P)-dependent oxidoreductase [Cryobacterium sp. MDB2-A-2]TFC10856.1 SDR family NAD(P)-dependent oxidoreductase [Cryobacterium sp. MDB2-33-2]TFC19261.1 SDR family NAD(P)-dependent oxidoreductase [Cryobacterium sp. MDB2-10]
MTDTSEASAPSARTIIITGGSDGIGAAAARALSRTGASVVIVGRSAAKTAAVAAPLGADSFTADFASLDEVRALAATLLERYPRIDVLANNAGGIMGKRVLTVDGHEKTFQVNHLAPFLLTTLLTDRLLESHARVINTASVANSVYARFDIDDLDASAKYSPNRAYGNAKLANILFTRELHHRYHEQGLTTAAFHPGVVATSFSSNSTSVMRFIYQTPLKRMLITPEQGSDTLVWLATAPLDEWISGEYYDKRLVAKANKLAYDPALAAALWERSGAMVAATAQAAPTLE